MAIQFKHKFNFEKFARFRAEPFYHSKWITKLITKLMKSGKRAVMERKIYEALRIIKIKTQNKNLAQYLTRYLYTIKPIIELRLRRQWNRLIPVPFPLKLRRQLIKAMSNLINKIRENPNKLRIKTRVRWELLEIQKKQESVLALKRDAYTHKVIFSGKFWSKRWK